MACPTVSKFLCCITLETGGLIMGWVTVIFSVILMAWMGFALAITVSLYNNFNPVFPNDQQLATGVFIFVVFVFAIALLYYFILIVASLMMIRGVRKREHTKLMPFMILMVIGIVIYVLQMIAATGAGGIVVAALMVVIVIYFYLCVYSLYDKLRNEKINPPQMQPYTQTVIYAQPYQPQTVIQPQSSVYPTIQTTSEQQPKPTAPV